MRQQGGNRYQIDRKGGSLEAHRGTVLVHPRLSALCPYIQRFAPGYRGMHSPNLFGRVIDLPKCSKKLAKGGRR